MSQVIFALTAGLCALLKIDALIGLLYQVKNMHLTEMLLLSTPNTLQNSGRCQVLLHCRPLFRHRSGPLASYLDLGDLLYVNTGVSRSCTRWIFFNSASVHAFLEQLLQHRPNDLVLLPFSTSRQRPSITVLSFSCLVRHFFSLALGVPVAVPVGSSIASYHWKVASCRRDIANCRWNFEKLLGHEPTICRCVSPRSGRPPSPGNHIQSFDVD